MNDEKTIYSEAISAAEKGGLVYVDLINKVLIVNAEVLIRNGECTLPLGLEKISREKCIEEIEYKFRIFEHSIPSERSDKAYKNWFLPLKENELSDDDMLYGEPRIKAKAELEVYVLLSILNGSLTWDQDNPYQWFWASEKYPRLILFKDWMK